MGYIKNPYVGHCCKQKYRHSYYKYKSEQLFKESDDHPEIVIVYDKFPKLKWFMQ